MSDLANELRIWYECTAGFTQDIYMPEQRDLDLRAADALEQAQGKVDCSTAIEKGAVKALSTASERIKQLEAALKDMFLLIDERWLVRNIENDDDPLWALNQLNFVRRLARNQKPIETLQSAGDS